MLTGHILHMVVTLARNLGVRILDRMQMRTGFPVIGLESVGIADGFPVTGSVQRSQAVPEHKTNVADR